MMGHVLKMQLEVTKHGPQWQRKVRVMLNDTRDGSLRVHGTMYMSELGLTILQTLLCRSDSAIPVTFIWVDDA